jgi:hypothetical protein
MIFEYLRAISVEGWRTTWKRFSSFREGSILASFLFVVGLAIHAWVRGWEEASENALVTILTGVAAIVPGAALVLVLDWLFAPYRLWRKDRQTINGLNSNSKLRADNRSIATKLEGCINAGQQVMRQSYTEHFERSVEQWIKVSVGQVLSLCRDEERAAFETRYNHYRAPAIADPYNVQLAIGILNDAIGDLRSMMKRYYRAAESDRRVAPSND